MFTVTVRFRPLCANVCQRSLLWQSPLFLPLLPSLLRGREHRRNSPQPSVSPPSHVCEKKKTQTFQTKQKIVIPPPQNPRGCRCIWPQPPQQGNLSLINCALLNGFRIKKKKCAWITPTTRLRLHPPPLPSFR